MPPGAVGGGPPATSSPLPFEQAVERVAAARCDKLRDCPSFLVDRYKSADACVGREISRVQAMWRDEKCPAVDGAALEECARAARAEKCDARGESLFVPIVGACAAARICPAE